MQRSSRDFVGLDFKPTVKNTFLEFTLDEEDPWIMDLNCRRQHTDSIIDLRRIARIEEDEKSTDEGSNNGASSQEEGSTPSDHGEPSALAYKGLRSARPTSCQPAEAHVVASKGASEAAREDHTTVMLRNVPGKYTQAKLMREINGAGFLGRFDFLYLPMDPRSKVNRGFAFCNFDSPESAKRFSNIFNGKKLRHFNSDKAVEVLPADIQGFENNAEHYMSARAMGRIRSNSKPLFLRPLPAHLLAEDEVPPEPQPQVPRSMHHPMLDVDAPDVAAEIMNHPMMEEMLYSMMSPGTQYSYDPCEAYTNGPCETYNTGVVMEPSATTNSFAPSALTMITSQFQDQQQAGLDPHFQDQQQTGLHSQFQDQQQSSAVLFCPYCGKQRQSSFLFCTFCGKEQPVCQ